MFKDRLAWYSNQRRALLAVNFYNYETLKGLLLAAKESKSEMILQVSESTLQYLGVNPAYSLAKSLLKEFDIKGWLHLDHGSNIEIIKKCLDAGFDSVMIDASERPFAENVRITREVVKLAENYNANVEAELGYVPKLGQEQVLYFTSAKEATTFAGETGINALAIAIGTAHGFYKAPPRLNIERLKEIREATPVALVLHGSSGVPDDQIYEAIKAGISKINLATETKNTFMTKLKQLLGESDEIDLRKVFPPAIEEVKQLIINKLRVINAE
ncbi:MAG: Fructose-bisphosphate aldolase, class II/tagatose 1,6-diphosphate aldolase GatY/KbaY [Chitinophagaceae bacterium]|nr:Fructose-bisphosphate aldolase, class II/tagatose 1,6-diphosphate aldolase GatY/KbaY [Chitinophagaceae bacterium]